MARIESDIILYNVGKKSAIAKFAAKWIFGINEKRIHALVKKIYGRLFGNQAANKQLYERLFYVLTNALDGSPFSSDLPCSYSFSSKPVGAIKSKAIRKKPVASKSIPIWKRVYHFFRSTLHVFGFIRVAKLKLSDRQIRLMDELIAPSRISAPSRKEDKGDPALVKTEYKPGSKRGKDLASLQAPAGNNDDNYDDSLKRMRSVASGIMEDLSKALHEEYVKKRVEDVQEIAKPLPNYLKKAAEISVILFNPTFRFPSANGFQNTI